VPGPNPVPARSRRMPSPTRPPAAVDDCTGPGEGVIEVTVVTNTGREFVYRQESENGAFIIPYSTTGSPYDVKTAGNYRIVGGTGELTATEEAVTGRA
jgi:hypothetical protein